MNKFSIVFTMVKERISFNSIAVVQGLVSNALWVSHHFFEEA